MQVGLNDLLGLSGNGFDQIHHAAINTMNFPTFIVKCVEDITNMLLSGNIAFQKYVNYLY